MLLVIILLVDAIKNVRLKFLDLQPALLSNSIHQPVNAVSSKLHYSQHLTLVQLKQIPIATSMLMHVKEVVQRPYGQHQLLSLLLELIIPSQQLLVNH